MSELIESESANLVGDYESEAAALRDVADTVAEYGIDSPEVMSLALIRLDVPRSEGSIAAGAAHAQRALQHFSPAVTMRPA